MAVWLISSIVRTENTTTVSAVMRIVADTVIAIALARKTLLIFKPATTPSGLPLRICVDQIPTSFGVNNPYGVIYGGLK